MRFIDEGTIRVKAGNGGHGAVSFDRAPFHPKGGPDGGDGGKGGSVIVRVDPRLNTLETSLQKRIYKAENGRPGQGAKRSGKRGRDTIIFVPPGTLVLDEETGDILADLIGEGEDVTVARGGKGGRGNRHFATSKNRAPRRAEPGVPGEEIQLKLELKLLADVGLVGRPNAGKSTLLEALSRAKPNIGAFPFSTLTPSLGVIPVGVYKRFVMADIPGLAEGARFGKGLGHQFLRHIERTKIIVMLIEASEDDYSLAFEKLMEELTGFSEDLIELPRIVVLSKVDLADQVKTDQNFNFDLKISSVSREGLDELVDKLAGMLGLDPDTMTE